MIFFLCGPFLVSLLNSLHCCFCCFMVFWPQIMRNASSQTRDWTSTPWVGRPSLNHWKVKVLVAQPCPTLCDPMDYSLPGSSDPWNSTGKNTRVGRHSFTRGFSWPTDWTRVSHAAGRFSIIWGPPGKSQGSVTDTILRSSKKFWFVLLT